MSIDWFTLSAQIVNFLILLVLLKRFLFGPLRNIMDKREEKVKSRLEEARKKLDEAEEKSQRYDHKLSKFEEKKDELMKEAREKAEEKKKEMLHEAREEIDNLYENWEESLEAEKETFFSELHRQTSKKIIELLDRLIKDLANSSLEEQAVNKFNDRLKNMDKKDKKRALHSALDSGEGEIVVSSSFELQEGQKEEIKKILHDVFKAEVSCSFKVNSNLGFGIEIRAEGWKMGWNAQIYLEELKQNIDDLFQKDTEISKQAVI
ncbi:MAG: F0F1 ATP synthase subunit B family protein [Candidatus Halalkalibacterium sp. M3_1C_030]